MKKRTAVEIQEAANTDRLKAWNIHLRGQDTKEISRLIGRPLRWVQIAIKTMKERVPANVEKQAIKTLVRELVGRSASAKAIIARIKRAFHVKLTPAEITKMTQTTTPVKAAKATKKVTKCKGKTCSCNKALKNLAAKKPVVRVAMSTPDTRKEFKDCVKKLPGKGNTKFGTFISKLIADFKRSPLVNQFCKEKKISIEDLVSDFSENEQLCKLFEKLEKDGALIGVGVSIRLEEDQTCCAKKRKC